MRDRWIYVVLSRIRWSWVISWWLVCFGLCHGELLELFVRGICLKCLNMVSYLFTDIQMQHQKSLVLETMCASFAGRRWPQDARNCHVTIFFTQAVCGHGFSGSSHALLADWKSCGCLDQHRVLQHHNHNHSHNKHLRTKCQIHFKIVSQSTKCLSSSNSKSVIQVPNPLHNSKSMNQVSNSLQNSKLVNEVPNHLQNSDSVNQVPNCL